MTNCAPHFYITLRSIGQMSKHYAWVFTCNNFNQEHVDSVRKLKTNYVVCGKEVGKEGTPHLQGFLYLTSRRTHTAMKKSLPGFWMEPKSEHSTYAEAIAYCTKDGDFHEEGTPPKEREAAGSREADRWDAAREDAKAGAFDSIPSDIYMRYRSTIHAMYADTQQLSGQVGEVDHLDSEWIWGAPGCGKSRKVRDENPDLYVKNANKWFCGYPVGASIPVLIDDLDKSHECLGYYLKIWGDRYPFKAEVKNSSLFIRPSKVLITSNYPPEEIFQDAALCAAIRRRYKVTHMHKL